MKIKKLKIVTAVAFAAIGLVSTSLSASASNVTDLILGFEITDGSGMGSGTNLELDLGAGSATGTLTPGVLNSMIGNDLSAIYGSGWATRTDLAWGVAGVSNNSHNNYQFETTATNGAQSNTTYGGMLAAYNGIAALDNAQSGGSATGAANSSGALTLSTGTAGSWTYQITDAGGSSQAGSPYFTTPTSETVVNGTKTADQSIELYGYASGNTNPGSDLGTFTLAGSGNNATFSFAAVATPEPSAYALGICAVLLFVVLKRRSSIA